jgi:GNAT superfamily N-acetyltransferase
MEQPPRLGVVGFQSTKPGGFRRIVAAKGEKGRTQQSWILARAKITHHKGATRLQLTRDVHVTWKDDQASKGMIEEESMVTIDANIWHRRSSKRIGYYHAYVLRPNWFGYDMKSFVWHCDAHSQPLLEFAVELLKSRIGLSRFTRGGEILFPELLEVLPAWRGEGIGAAVFKAMLKVAEAGFDVSVCAFQPDPLQFKRCPRHEDGGPQVSREYDAALDSLRRYYVETFGAKPLRPGSPYYYLRIPALQKGIDFMRRKKRQTEETQMSKIHP